MLPSLLKAESSVFSYETERLMRIRLVSGHQLSELMILYETQDTWFFPLGEFTESLGFPIVVSEDLGIAEGKFLSREADFRLDLQKCTVKSDGYSADFSGANEGCPLAIKHEGALYVSQESVEQWFPMVLVIDSLGSEVTVDPSEPLPLMEKIERMKRAKKVKSSSSSIRRGNDDYHLVEGGDAFISAPFFRQEFGYQLDGNSSAKMQSFTASGAASFEVAKLHSQTFFNYRNQTFGALRTNLSRRDPNGEIAGPLGITEISLLNTSKFRTPLVSGGGLLFGARVSSFALSNSGSFSEHKIEGDLRPGWEVELYQNGILLDRSTGDENSRYTFENISLLFGTNRLKLVFYGPQGQREEKTEILRIRNNFLRPGEWDYKALVGNGEYAATQIQLSVEKNIFNRFNARFGFDQLDLSQRDISGRYASIGVSGFWPNLLLETNLAQDLSGGSALSMSARFPFLFTQSELKWTELREFSSDVLNSRPTDDLLRQFEYETQFKIPIRPTVSVNLDASVLEYERSGRVFVLGNRLSSRLFGFSLRNQADFTFSGGATSLAGTFETSYRINRNRLRVTTDYSFDGFQGIEADYRWKYRKTYFFNPSLRYTVPTELVQASLGFSKDFKSFSLSTQTFIQSDETFGVGVDLSTSFGTTETGGANRFHHRDMTQDAAAKVLIYIDKNRNGQRDEEEEVVPDMRITVNGKEGDAVTRENGIAWVTHLNSYQRNELSLSRRDIKDPMLTLDKPGYAFVGRPAMVQFLEIPLVYIGEIDGIVELVSEGRVKPAIKVQVELYKEGVSDPLQRVMTDREGIYLFTDVAPGIYTVRIAERSQNFDENVKPRSHRVEIMEGGAIEAGFNFLLSSE